MSSTTTIERHLGGTLQRFRLAMTAIPDIEKQAGCGVLELARRLVQGGWRSTDVREVIRLGLVGGGMVPAAADKLIVDNVDDQPLQPSAELAASIVWAVVIGSDAVDRLDTADNEGGDDGSAA